MGNGFWKPRKQILMKRPIKPLNPVKPPSRPDEPEECPSPFKMTQMIKSLQSIEADDSSGYASSTDEDVISRGKRCSDMSDFNFESKQVRSDNSDTSPFVDDHFSNDELKSILDTCSSTSSPQQSPSESESTLDDEQPLEIRFITENGRITLDESQIRHLLLDKKIQTILPKYFENNKLLFKILELGKKNKIDNFIDVQDDNGNSSIFVALSFQNIEAVTYIAKGFYPFIPPLITEGYGKTYPIFQYLLEHPSLRSIFDVIFHVVLEMFDSQQLHPYFCNIDPESGLSLPHYLIVNFKKLDIQYRELQCYIRSILKKCKQSFDVECPLLGCNMKGDLLMQAIAIDNTDIVECIGKCKKFYDISKYETFTEVVESQRCV